MVFFDPDTFARLVLDLLDRPDVRAKVRELLTPASTPAAASVERVYETPAQFAERHGVSSKTVGRWASKGMPHHMIGKRQMRIQVRDACAWVENGSAARRRKKRRSDGRAEEVQRPVVA